MKVTIQVPIRDFELKRLDDCTWSYPQLPGTLVQDPKLPEIDEVRIQTPALSTPGQAYELAQLIAKTIQTKGVFPSIQAGNAVGLNIERHSGSLNGKWVVSLSEERALSDRLFQWIPFVKTYPPHHFASLQVSRAEKDYLPSFVHKIKDYVLSRPFIPVDGELTRLPIPPVNLDFGSFSNRFKQPNFSDPFTQIARTALQTVETHFVSERAMQGSCRLVLDKENRLGVQLISLTDDIEANRRTVRSFRDFMIDEYGPEPVHYVQYAYGFRFEDMIERGLPLLPDHVFKMNVGVNNIEMAHIEDLYRKLHQLRYDLALHASKRNLDEVLQYYHSAAAPVRFNFRELRGLLALAKKNVTAESSLKAFLDRLLGNMIPDHIPHLMPEQFNAIVSMIWPSAEDIQRALTGRMITHLAICGYKTMGDPNESDPCRDQAELMQIFSELQQSEKWDNFYEMLAHVAVKKNLFREYPNENGSIWRTGVLIPAPCTTEKTTRWYCVCKVQDDGEGNLNYILLPAAKGYRIDGRPMPMIHLYRSTNSDHNSIDSIGSIENDLNPQRAPGSLGEEMPKGMKGGFFFNRTIPLWVGYLIEGNNQKTEKKKASYRKSLEELERQLCESEATSDRKKMDAIAKLKVGDSADDMRAFLTAEGEASHELPKHKRAQDLVFIGHSLGGALAQYGAHYFGPGSSRIPCPGCNLTCRSYNGPATNTAIDLDFMKFGREHRELIQGLSQHWKIFHQFEYGDFVPEAGESHLGTEDYHEEIDSEWLDVQIQIFRPLESAHALPITTCPTHGRRIGQATPNFDYELRNLTPKQLSEYDHAWVLSGDLKETFGYRILLSPTITEIARRSIGTVGVPLIHLSSSIHNYFQPEKIKRNYEGIFTCEYKAANLQPAVWLNQARV